MSKNEEIKGLKHEIDVLKNQIDELNLLRRELELEKEILELASDNLVREREDFCSKIKDLYEAMDLLSVSFGCKAVVARRDGLFMSAARSGSVSDAYQAVHETIEEQFSDWL